MSHPKLVPSPGAGRPHLIHVSLAPPESTPQTATRSVQPRNVGNNRLHLVLYISLMAIWPNNSSSSSTVNIELTTAHYRAQNGHAWSVLVGTATSNNHTTMMMMMIAAAAAAAVYYYNQQSAVPCSCQYSDM